MRRNLILLLWEIRHSENDVSKFRLSAYIGPVPGSADVAAHDFGRRERARVVSRNLAKAAYRNSFRASVRSGRKRFRPDGKHAMEDRNSQVCGELGHRADRMHCAENLGCARYRALFCRYCIWENEFAWKFGRGDAQPDTQNLKSRMASINKKYRRAK